MMIMKRLTTVILFQKKKLVDEPYSIDPAFIRIDKQCKHLWYAGHTFTFYRYVPFPIGNNEFYCDIHRSMESKIKGLRTLCFEKNKNIFKLIDDHSLFCLKLLQGLSPQKMFI